MHDPQTVAHEIKNPFAKTNGGYKSPLITIWHVDPETDGTDDSCGWFMRSHHGDKKVLEEIRKEFAFNFKNNYWFTEDGIPLFSTSGIILQMYSQATWIFFKMNRKRQRNFNNKHLWDILLFAENSTDSLSDAITQEYRYRLIQHDRSQVDSQEDRIKHLANVIYGDILRKNRKWYQHPRWHVWHWKIQFHPFQNVKRRYWDKCCVCGKRGFKGSAMSDWGGTKRWHMECDKSAKPIQNEINIAI